MRHDRKTDGDGNAGAVEVCLAFLCAIVCGLVVEGLAELASLPWRSAPGGLSLAVAFGASLGQLSQAFVDRFPVLIGLCAVAPVASLAARRWPRGRLALAGAVVASGVLLALSIYLTLASYNRFAGYAPFVVATAVLALALGAGLLLAWWTSAAPWVRRARLVSASLGIVAAAGACSVNAVYYPKQYPSLHLALAALVFVGAFVGVANGLVHFGRGPRGRSILNVALVVAGLLFVLSTLAGELLATARLKQFLAQHSFVAREALLASAGRGVRTDASELPCSLGSLAALSQEEALRLFERHGRMPSLPTGWSLEGKSILWVSIESLRFDDTSFGDRESGRTRTLEDLARAGAFVFTDAHSPSSATNQTMSAVFAMTLPSHVPSFVGLRHWTGQLKPGTNTAIDGFNRAGYSTFVVGNRWSIVNCGDRLKQKFDWRKLERVIGDEANVDDKIVAQAIPPIRRLAKLRQRFFGWLFFFGPHYPYLAREEGDHGPRARYRQEVRRVDEMLGRVLKAMVDSRLLERTVIVVAGDHGEEFGEHGGKHHAQTVYGEVTHVPLVIWVPGVKGRRVDSPTSLAYVLPWLLLHANGHLRELAQKAITDEIAPMMKATGGLVVCELLAADRMQVALFDARSKLIADLTTGWREFYDLRTDRREQRDTFESAPPRLSRYNRALQGYRLRRACKRRFEIVQLSD